MFGFIWLVRFRVVSRKISVRCFVVRERYINTKGLLAKARKSSCSSVCSSYSDYEDVLFIVHYIAISNNTNNYNLYYFLSYLFFHTTDSPQLPN